MCGIFALVQPSANQVNLHDIRRACSLLRHRGPDQSGYAFFNNRTVGFGHTRLSIQDPDAPPQPLVDPTTGTAIIFNGEVYDHTLSRHDLEEKHGVTFTESTDTAVILALYILYGPTCDFFSRLNGEFSFVIWDAQRRKIIAARDRFGVKPLYWYYDNARLCFASEIKAVLSLEGIPRKFSNAWLDSVDITCAQPLHLTFIEDIFALLPGKYLSMDLSHASWTSPKYETYWSALPLLRALDTSRTYEEAKAELRKLLIAAVKRRLVADRRMCVYLSGGVDSTVLCGIIHSLGHPLTSITIGFGDHPLSEEDLAVKTAEYYSLKHEKVTFTLEDTARLAEKMIYHIEAASTNPHTVAKFRLSEFAHQQDFVVSLSGEGSDEILLGYSPFRSDILLEMRSRGGAHAAKVQNLAEDLAKRESKDITFLVSPLPEETPRVRGTPSWQAWQVRRLQVAADALRAPSQDGRSLPMRTLDGYAPKEADGLPGVRLGQLKWLATLHNYIIPCLGDRVEMASSIEGRPPLLDAAFADFALRLPQDYLIDPDTLREKKILYEAFEDILPPHILSRTKQPFIAPGWYDTLVGTEAGRSLKERYLSREALEHVGVWLPERVENLLLQLKKGAVQLDGFLGLVLSVQILHALFIENRSRGGDPDFVMVDRTLQSGC